MTEQAVQVENKELAARIMAVQAYYQFSQGETSMRNVINEYLDRGMQADAEEEGDEPIVTIKPHNALFKRIMTSVNARLAEVDEIVLANVKKDETNTKTKQMEPLLKAILICGVSELLEHGDIDTALIIDDYLNATYGFYDKGQVSYVNGILDNVAKQVR